MDNSNQNLIHELNEDQSKTQSSPNFIMFILIIVVLGIASGFIFSKINKSGDISIKKITTPVAKTAGIKDKKNFKDKVEGILKEGGIDGEGSFHLDRPGGLSQNVYLTSSTVDLSLYVGRKVRVWGETFKGKSAGWLMDVGYVESL